MAVGVFGGLFIIALISLAGWCGIAVFTAAIVMVGLFELYFLTSRAKSGISVYWLAFSCFVSYGIITVPGVRAMLGLSGFLLLFGCVWANDLAALYVGRRWGKRHFTKISPKKTIEGLIAGMVASLLVGILGWTINQLCSPLLLHPILIGLVAAIFTPAGDLLFSLFKRKAGAKDFSKILPGHGGMLDRFDGYLATVFVLYVALKFVR